MSSFLSCGCPANENKGANRKRQSAQQSLQQLINFGKRPFFFGRDGQLDRARRPFIFVFFLVSASKQHTTSSCPAFSQSASLSPPPFFFFFLIKKDFSLTSCALISMHRRAWPNGWRNELEPTDISAFFHQVCWPKSGSFWIKKKIKFYTRSFQKAGQRLISIWMARGLGTWHN